MGARPECRRCGCCCKTFPILAGGEDVAREPRIAEEAVHLGNGIYSLRRPPFNAGVLGAGRCVFQTADGLCDIFDTRPAVCAQRLAGSAMCDYARVAGGLLPLEWGARSDD